jgi:hypothetical protein
MTCAFVPIETQGHQFKCGYNKTKEKCVAWGWHGRVETCSTVF